MIKKFLYFFQQTLWDLRLKEEKGIRYFLFKWLKIFSLAIKDFIQDQCPLRASSLSYYAALSVVPIVAMLFGMAGMVEFDGSIRESLLLNFPDQKGVLLKVFDLSENLIKGFHSGVIAAVGFTVLFWSVWCLLGNLEKAMNQIWEVEKHRSWKRIVSDYFALTIIVPLFFFMASSAGVVMEKILGFHLFFLPYLLFWLLFTFIYKVVPNGTVPTASTFAGGLIAAGLYIVVQWVYVYFQIRATHYGAVYGSLAALPLFLVWVQSSWYIFLFGAEVGHAHQVIMNNNQ